MAQPPNDPHRHPGYGPNPPAAAPWGYGTAPQPQSQFQAQSPAGGAPQAARNPLGLASLIVGAIPSVLGVLFLFVQAAVITSGDASTFGLIGGVNSLLSGLLGAAALILGLVATSRRGASKTLAAAGIALGAAALVSVFGGLIYTGVLNALY